MYVAIFVHLPSNFVTLLKKNDTGSLEHYLLLDIKISGTGYHFFLHSL